MSAIDGSTQASGADLGIASPNSAGQGAGRPLRICVLGGSCCGKSTLSRRLASILGVPHIELDALYHGPNWTETPPDIFAHRVNAAIEQAPEGWVADGNYFSKIGPLVLGRADIAVFLDLPFFLAFKRAVTRSLRRLVTRPELWNGNREELRFMLTKDWIPTWVIRTHARHRVQVRERIAAHPHLQVVRLRTEAEVRAWLDSVHEKRDEPVVTDSKC